MFCIPVSTGALKGDKSLKMPSDSISASVIFLGSMLPEPLILACFACPCALHTMTLHIPATPTSTMMTHLAVPLFQKSGSTPVGIA